MDVGSRLHAAARRTPDGVAIRWHDRSVTYAELDQRVDAAAAGLQSLGVAPRDRVAVVAGNVPETIEAIYATLRCGAVVVPLNPDSTAPELRHALGDSGAHVTVAAASAIGAVDEAATGLDTVRHVLAIGDSGAGHRRWREVGTAGDRPQAITRRSDDLAAIVYTSGTSGRPRGAMLTRGNLLANQDQSVAGRFQVTPDDVMLLVLPLFHIYAFNVGLGVAVRASATVLLAERFDPVATLDLVERERVTVVLGAPPMYVAWSQVADLDRRDLGSVRLATSGAAPLPPAVFERFRDRTGIAIEEGYGLTEAGPAVTSSAMAPAPRAGSVGMPLPAVQVRLVDDAGSEPEVGDPGEVHVRGPNVFSGYWGDPDATAEVLDADGWLRTGDVGVRDADGYLYLVDRRRDLILVSGFNVYPQEVETVLREHPDVADCAVVGQPHPYTGESVRAVVVRAAGAEVSADDVIAHCRRSLARYKCPAAVEFVDALPYTATGKLRRVALRDGGPVPVTT